MDVGVSAVGAVGLSPIGAISSIGGLRRLGKGALGRGDGVR